MVERRRHQQMADLDTALDWLRDHWPEQREAPLRLTVHDTEGELGGLAYSGAFAALLAWHPGQVRTVEATTICGHPLVHGRTDECPECWGVGVKTIQADRYTYPMTIALRRLAAYNGRSALLLVTLAVHGWSVEITCRLAATRPPRILAAVRQLHRWYQAGPVPWIEKSESQQAAEVAS